MTVRLSDNLKRALLEDIPGFIVREDGATKAQFDAVEFSLEPGVARIMILNLGREIGSIEMPYFPGESVTLSGIEGFVKIISQS